MLIIFVGDRKLTEKCFFSSFSHIVYASTAFQNRLTTHSASILISFPLHVDDFISFAEYPVSLKIFYKVNTPALRCHTIG